MDPSGSSVVGLRLSRVLPGPGPPTCLLRQGAFRAVPLRELAHNTVIYAIYLFLALGPLANCKTLCWIRLEFNHAFIFPPIKLFIYLINVFTAGKSTFQ